jgi:hypothetical protein
MSAHTRGPWVALPCEADKKYLRVRGTRLGARYKIANVLVPEYEGAEDREVDETFANALLIAAAPDLLDALRRLLDDADEFLTLQGRRKLAHDAVAKATGVAP